MKFYQANGNATIGIKNVEPENTQKVKIKVTHVMPTLSDINLFSGSIVEEKTYPFVPGHIAIGVVSDDREEYGLKRGTKVILNPYIVEESVRSDFPDSVKTRGIDIDGFMRDFVFLEIDEFVPFPDDMEENEAIFVGKIAMALSALSSFHYEKGDYIAIIGASAIGNILAQLSMYFQLIPILIDDDEYRLQKAKDKGVYYTINASKEVPSEMVKAITGGRMCEHTVVDEACTTGAYIFQLVKSGGNVAIICEKYGIKSLDADVSLISKNNLTVKGIANGAGEFDTAINIVAQRILDLNDFIEKRVSVDDCEELFKEFASNPDYYFTCLLVI